MDHDVFERTFDELCELNAKEGPHTNVLEPKFAAQSQLSTLMETLRNVARERPSREVQRQMCRCCVLFGTSKIEVDEDKEGLQELLRAHALIGKTIKGEVTPNLADVAPDELAAVLLSDSHPFAASDSGEGAVDSIQFAFEYLEVVNAICVYLANSSDTKFRLDDARKLLHRAERAFLAWSSWSATLPRERQFHLKDVHVSDAGKVITEGLSAEQKSAAINRYRMESSHTTTIFLLSQVYGQKGDVFNASKYCHRTLLRQLLTRQEFSRKEWAKNCIMLSTFFASQRDFGKSLYCVRAGEHMMPSENADEDTRGVVCWGFGRHHLNRLMYYAAVVREEEELSCGESRADEWWEEFDGMPFACTVLPHITTFDQARDEFKEGLRWMQEALKFYVIDGCCTDHIKILQDIGLLYKTLIAFEPDVDRRIAMHQRRIALVEALPDELNFQSYATLIRQLLFDIGDMYSEILDLRLTQKKDPEGKSGKPLSDSKINLLSEKASSYFRRFVETYRDLKTQKLPEVFETEARVPVFRALMRLAHLSSKTLHKSPQDEFAGIERTIEMYDKALKFAAANAMGSEVETELKLAREMMTLLPGKQRDLRRVYSSHPATS